MRIYEQDQCQLDILDLNQWLSENAVKISRASVSGIDIGEIAMDIAWGTKDILRDQVIAFCAEQRKRPASAGLDRWSRA